MVDFAPPPHADQIAARRRSTVMALLACPSCHAALVLRDEVRVADTVVDAELDCPSCGNVGVVRTCRPSFLPDDLGDAWAPPGLAERPIDLRQFDGAIGTWLPHGRHGMIAIDVGGCLTAETTFDGVAVTLGTHTWGGRAQVAFGDLGEEIELYSADPTIRRVVLCATASDAAAAPRRWSVVLASGSDSRRQGDQMIVSTISDLIPAPELVPAPFQPFNNGNPYPPRFEEILRALPNDAVVIDVGGGDRCHPDPRVLNFEYMKFDGPDFFGDGLRLPIADASVDFVLSQAVLEHVAEPQRAVDELRRILKPSGRIYAEFAFMQPLHAVPYHFFNITPHGANLLFQDWDVTATGTFGGLAPTMEWFFALLAADRKIGPEAARHVIDQLAELDRQLTAHELDFVASAVFVEAHPRGATPDSGADDDR